MSAIKLARLPDRTPVRQVMIFTPEQHKLMIDYAAFYAAEHGEAAPLADLLPAMLEAFVRSDKAFAKAMRAGRANA